MCLKVEWKVDNISRDNQPTSQNIYSPNRSKTHVFTNPSTYHTPVYNSACSTIADSGYNSYGSVQRIKTSSRTSVNNQSPEYYGPFPQSRLFNTPSKTPHRQDIYRPVPSQLDSRRQNQNACQKSSKHSNEASKSNDYKVNLPDHASEINNAQDADKLSAAESKSPNSTNDSKSQLESDKSSNELTNISTIPESTSESLTKKPSNSKPKQNLEKKPKIESPIPEKVDFVDNELEKEFDANLPDDTEQNNKSKVFKFDPLQKKFLKTPNPLPIVDKDLGLLDCTCEAHFMQIPGQCRFCSNTVMSFMIDSHLLNCSVIKHDPSKLLKRQSRLLNISKDKVMELLHDYTGHKFTTDNPPDIFVTPHRFLSFHDAVYCLLDDITSSAQAKLSPMFFDEPRFNLLKYSNEH